MYLDLFIKIFNLLYCNTIKLNKTSENKVKKINE